MLKSETVENSASVTLSAVLTLASRLDAVFVCNRGERQV
jgi:hypothetical protein